jgi:hypothetical protein
MDAVGLGVDEMLPNVGRMEQALGRDTSHQKTVPPSLACFSTSAVFNPYWPARIAAE